jgi:hypothetical protein
MDDFNSIKESAKEKGLTIHQALVLSVIKNNSNENGYLEDDDHYTLLTQLTQERISQLSELEFLEMALDEKASQQ